MTKARSVFLHSSDCRFVVTLLFALVFCIQGTHLKAEDDLEGLDSSPRWTVAVDIDRGDLWIDFLRDRKVESSVRLGPGGSISDLRHRLSGNRRLLAPSWQLDNTDRIVQWSIWSESLRLDHHWASRMNVTQGGRASGQFSEIVDVRLRQTPSRVRVVVASKHDEQWLDRVQRRIKASFPSLTIYDASNEVISIDRYVLVHSLRMDGVKVPGSELYFEGWSPFSDASFNRMVFGFDAKGNPRHYYTDSVNIPHYTQIPFGDTRGFVTLLHQGNPLGPKLHLVFGKKRAAGGARARLNTMDFEGGMAILPSLQKDHVVTGSLIHQHLRLVMTRTLSPVVLQRLDREVAKVPAAGIYAPDAIPRALQETAAYLRTIHGEPGLRTDKLALLLD